MSVVPTTLLTEPLLTLRSVLVWKTNDRLGGPSKGAGAGKLCMECTISERGKILCLESQTLEGTSELCSAGQGPAPCCLVAGGSACLRRASRQGWPVGGELGEGPAEPGEALSWPRPSLAHAHCPHPPSRAPRQVGHSGPGTWGSYEGPSSAPLSSISAWPGCCQPPPGSQVLPGPLWAGDLGPPGLLSWWAGTGPQMVVLERPGQAAQKVDGPPRGWGWGGPEAGGGSLTASVGGLGTCPHQP